VRGDPKLADPVPAVADGPTVRVVIITLDHHIASAVERAAEALCAEVPGLVLSLHAATAFRDADALDACLADVARGDIVFANMLFIDAHIRAVLPALKARRDACDALVCAMSAAEVMRLTRMGRFAKSARHCSISGVWR